jgi:uncharacterized protein (DUF885 family)
MLESRGGLTFMMRDRAVASLKLIVALWGVLTLLAAGGSLLAAPRKAKTDKPPASAAPAADLDSYSSAMRPFIERYTADLGALERTYPISVSPTRQSRLARFYAGWREQLAKMDFEALDVESRADYLLFDNRLRYEERQLELRAKQFQEIEPLLPFAGTIISLEETRRRMEPVDSKQAATRLDQMKSQIAAVQKQVEAGLPGARPDAKTEPLQVKKTAAYRAVSAIRSLRGHLKDWFDFYYGYDPQFTWWADQPYREADRALGAYAAFLSEKLVGVKLEKNASAPSGDDDDDDRPRPGGRGGSRTAVSARAGDASDIIGDPIGRDALMVELENEMIPYTPEELIAIGQKELAWCEAEMKKASGELGFGDDWHRALEHVKNLYVEPGKQPQLIVDLEREAEKFLDDHDLITIPPLARETWRMEMMSPERQLVNPFFTGGETIRVSYPTSTMSHEAKMMSMRGNNPHFSRATVHHELIAGHHLQQFMNSRYRPYRRLFATPFWTEGWALYWELLLWDRGFVKTPEDRIGMLFWRMHRCARIIFSLSFYLEKMTPQQCIDFLVERVGHERENATAEVRRSFESAPPLYQAAYLLGGLQIRQMHRELVETGKITDRQFHDAIIRQNRMPIEILRAILTGAKLPRDFRSNWKFYGTHPGS